MRVHVSTWLPCSVQQAWEAIQSSALLLEVSPRLGDPSTLYQSSVPERWTEASQIILQLPWFGRRTIQVVQVDDRAHVIETRERDSVVRRWNHRMEVKPASESGCWYSDTVDIGAGVYTLPVYLMAEYMYRYRHRGWKKVAKRLMSDEPAKERARG
jgi:hypothetical protein